MCIFFKKRMISKSVGINYVWVFTETKKQALVVNTFRYKYYFGSIRYNERLRIAINFLGWRYLEETKAFWERLFSIKVHIVKFNIETWFLLSVQSKNLLKKLKSNTLIFLQTETLNLYSVKAIQKGEFVVFLQALRTAVFGVVTFVVL